MIYLYIYNKKTLKKSWKIHYYIYVLTNKELLFHKFFINLAL